jgi:hypothetical protein
MPSRLPLPSIAELRRAFHDGARGTLDRRGDTHDGSNFDDIAGVSAIIWSRQAQRDADLFRANYLSGARGADLTDRVQQRFGIARVLDTKGTGTVVLTRASASAGGGTFWQGTRIRVRSLDGRSESLAYAVAADTAVGSTALVAYVPIVAPATGDGYVLDTLTAGGIPPIIEDALWDPSWQVSRLTCAAGTPYESDKSLLSRALQAHSDTRVGYERIIVDTCRAQGAANVQLYRSSFAGPDNDFGLNSVYVGDSGFSATPTLIRKCIVALESVRVLGADLAVRAMASAPLDVTANVFLWDDPNQVDVVDVQGAIGSGLVGYFTGKDRGFSYRLDAMAGAMTRNTSLVQSVAFTSPTSDAPILQGTPPQPPLVLLKYQLRALSFSFKGPQ